MRTSTKTHPTLEKLQGRNLYLVGMMGSGKSTTANLLAKHLKYSFIDTDSIIEELVQTSIKEFFEENDEEEFRDIESKVLQSIGQHHSLVVATGGGIIMRPSNWAVLHQGIVVWLDVSIDQLVKRLFSDKGKRPLVNDSNPRPILEELFQKRKPLYEESDLKIVIEKGKEPEQIARLILDKLLDILQTTNDPT